MSFSYLKDTRGFLKSVEASQHLLRGPVCVGGYV